jgi:hypothetical protein
MESHIRNNRRPMLAWEVARAVVDVPPFSTGTHLTDRW